MRVLVRLSFASAALLAVAGCSAPLSAPDLQQQDRCRQEADRQFDRQNRYLMSERDQTGTPFSARDLPGDTSRGLDDLYRRDRMVDDCMHQAGDGRPAAVPPAAPAR